MSRKLNCPVCNSTDIKVLYTSTVPVLQNRVYNTVEEAKQSGKGAIELTICNACKFAFNGSFDNNIIIYDEHYENSVPSQLFLDYYKHIAKYLYDKYKLSNEVMYDIGCGKGTFLNLLCDLYPDAKGIGVDPSYEGELNPIENLHFIKDFFHESQISAAPKLVISRHVFEHIEYPVAFLQIIQKALKAYKDVPFFMEVPDFAWIVKNKTFWDLCYEHCNYLSNAPLIKMFKDAGASLTAITPAFNEQYMWVEGILNPSNTSDDNITLPELVIDDVDSFINSISNLQANIHGIIADYKAKDYKVAVWGMATKGVIFTNIIDADKKHIDYCIDINKEKQSKHSPVTAHLLQPPNVLMGETAKLVVIVMNTNYLQEIKNEANSFVNDCVFIDAHGNFL